MNIYFDIETIPSQRPDIHALLAADVSPPGNIKLAETIAKWERESKPAAVQKAIHDTGLSGTFGEVWCIAWAVDDGPVEWTARNGDEYDEADILRVFFSAIDAVAVAPTFVGHYIHQFDLPFLWKRSVVNLIFPPSFIPWQAKPWDANIYDTRIQWAGKDHISQDNLCRALGIEPETGLHGDEVWDAVKTGNYRGVIDHCIGDVRRVREIHKRMTFAT